MKKLLLIVFSIGITFICCVFAESGSFDFRNSNWGDEHDKVKKTENAYPYIDNNKILAYKTRFEFMNCAAWFRFKDGQLNDGAYFFEQKHDNDNGYIDDYYKAKNYLEKKYGTPFRSNKKWKDRTFENDEANWGIAIRKGHLNMGSEWRNERTNILLCISGKDDSIRMMILYTPINALPESKEEK